MASIRTVSLVMLAMKRRRGLKSWPARQESEIGKMVRLIDILDLLDVGEPHPVEISYGGDVFYHYSAGQAKEYFPSAGYLVGALEFRNDHYHIVVEVENEI